MIMSATFSDFWTPFSLTQSFTLPSVCLLFGHPLPIQCRLQTSFKYCPQRRRSGEEDEKTPPPQARWAVHEGLSEQDRHAGHGPHLQRGLEILPGVQEQAEGEIAA